jgi:hypothetical protein
MTAPLRALPAVPGGRLPAEEIRATTRPTPAERRIIRAVDALRGITDDLPDLNPTQLRQVAALLDQTIRAIRDIGVPVVDLE